jgi:DNA-directed RNA polymerase subunit M/transcription elongation factor TFIIS
MATDRPTTCYACGRDITQTVYCVECAHERPAGEKDRQEPPEDRLAIGVHASESDAAAPAGSGRDRICPKCTSNDIYLKWFSMHGLPERLECRCRECGYKWSEPGDDARVCNLVDNASADSRNKCTIEDVVDRLKKLLRNRLAAGGDDQ